MSKMFLTKYQASVDNENLPVLGDLVCTYNKADNDNTEANKRILHLTYNDSVAHNIRIVGDGHITDDTLTADNGKNIALSKFGNIYFSNEGGQVYVGDKYNLQTFLNYPYSGASSDQNKGMIGIDISTLKFSPLIVINLSQSYSITGNISSLANSTLLQTLILDHSSVTGDISSLANLTALTYLILAYNSVTGDISSLANLTAMKNLYVYNVSVTGDISSLANLTSLEILVLSYTSITGDVTKIVEKCTKLKTLIIPNTVTISDEQKQTLTDRGCTVQIRE